MAYTNLQFGSTGEDVKKLQQELYNKGYTEVGKADGIFGKNTLAAVKRYQTENNLTVDGIAGKNTQGLLYSNPTPAPTPTPTPTPTPSTKTESDVPKVSNPTAPPPATNTTASGYTYTEFAPSDETNAAGQRREEILSQKPGAFTYDPYAKSDIVLQAESLLQQWTAGKPGEYTPVWQDEADAYLSQYQNRDPFSYDFNSDALYNQYKDMYIQQGRMAMMDTMGQAAAMTGGYGNSYAQTVGQQAYNQQLGQLNEIMPELYGMAYDRYTQEGQDLLNMYGIYMDKENQEYSRYQDNLDNWYTHLDFLQKDAATKSQEDYSRWQDKVGMDYDLWQDGYDGWLDQYNQADKDYWNLYDRDYNAWSDETSMGFDDHWKNIDKEQQDKEFDYGVKQDNYDKLAEMILTSGYIPHAGELEAAGMTQRQAKALRDGYTASVSNTGGNGDGTGESGIKLDNVASMSSYELVGYLESYQKKGNNTGLAAFLDDCVLTGRLAQGQADAYYAQYVTEDKPGYIDTSVDATGTPTSPTANPTTTTVDPFKERQQQNREKSNKGRSRK